MTRPAVLARIERIRPNADGSGKLTYRGPMHLFNGGDHANKVGAIRAWCGIEAATVDLAVVEDRSWPSPLAADLCGRCFLLPSRPRRRSA